MKVFVLCKHKSCRFKQIGKHDRLWYPLCSFKGTCNQQLMVYKNILARLNEEPQKTLSFEPQSASRLVVGGLHINDFEQATQLYEALGYVLVAFILERDGYHWKAIYVKNSDGEPGE